MIKEVIYLIIDWPRTHHLVQRYISETF
jgi:hypothetical protein